MVGRIASRRSSVLGIVALGASAWLAASAAYAATIQVTHLVDDTNTANGTCTLREAIRAANGNVAVDACPAGQSGVRDAILVKPGVHQVSLVSGAGEDLAVTGDLDLRGPVWIRGASSRYSIIEGSAGAVDRLFEIHEVAEDVVLEGVALRGGHPATAPKDGGVLRNLETGANDVELLDVEIAGGLAESGGGISNAGNLKIQRSRIIDNQTEQSPGTAGNHGGGIISDGLLSRLRIEDSEIRDNQAEEDGGGVWVGSASFVIHRSAIADNVAGDAGGGLYAGPGSDGFDVQYVELTRNRATDGGGMFMGAPGEVQRSAFVANEATLRGGGMIDVAGGFARFSTFAQNVAQEGGGIWANAPQTLLDSDTLAENQGGGVYNQSGVFLENDLFADNAGGNCTGNAPNFGAFNMEKGDSCGLGPTPTGPNFIDTDPILGALADNGGPTPTMALLPGSPAIDVVSSEIRTNCQNMRDQRGYPRGRPHFVNGSNEDVYLCDIGAFEQTPPFVVDSLADAVDADPADDLCAALGGGCTLRAAIQQANAIPGMNEIVLGTGGHVLALLGAGESAAATGDLDLVPPVLVRGAGVGLTSVDGAGLDRVFEIGTPPTDLAPAPATSFIRDLTITGGDAGAANGGGIAVRSPLRIERVRLTANDGIRGSAMSSAPTGFSFGADRPHVEIVDSTIDGNPGGGALYLADAVLERSSLIDNLADGGLNGGGGEFLKLRLENSTVSGNYSAATGAFFSSSALIENSTIYGNTADAGFDPGGVFLLELSVFRNSIIANNRAGGVVQNCAANPNGITSLGHNVTDGNGTDCLLTAATDRLATDPLLGALASNGGPTLTHLLLAGSSAIDGGDPVVCTSTDQRGTPRPRDGDGNGSAICDIGAVEVPEPARAAQLLAGGFAMALGERVRRSRRPRNRRREGESSE